MTAILFDFATHADYRAAVKKTYTVPAVGDPM